ncbi:MAG: hypothetical protein IKZ46_08385, partial [Victivallales bacterium]|nr:hypothetical protein [Victivallales bacterium]
DDDDDTDEENDGDDTNGDQGESHEDLKSRVRHTKSELKHKGTSFDFMDEKRSTIHIDKIVEEKELIIGNETAPDEPPKKPLFIISRKIQN